MEIRWLTVLWGLAVLLALSLAAINAASLLRIRRALKRLDVTLVARNLELHQKATELQKQNYLILRLSDLVCFVLRPDHDPRTPATAERRLQLVQKTEEAAREVRSVANGLR